MNNVVMIAYSFPPEGSAGAYRPLRFCRHLPAMGWRASVIAVAKDHYERYDPGLGALVPDDTEVIRVRGQDLWQAYQAKRNTRMDQRLSTASAGTLAQIRRAHKMPLRSLAREAIRTLEAWWYHPDMARPWIQPAVEETVRLCQRTQARVIWATAPPVSSLCVAQRASRITGVPYVLDFRDPLTFVPNDFETRRLTWAIHRDRRRMFRLLQGAQAVVFRHAMDAECFWRAYPTSMQSRNVHLIPNGYDGEIKPCVPPVGDKCTVVYSGTLTGAPYRYDTLLESLELLKEIAPVLSKRLRLLFIGEGAELLKDQCQTFGISDMVEGTGPLPQAQISRLCREAHAFLVLGLVPTVRGYELLVASKLFSYFQGGKPIIGVLPRDETNRFLKRVGVTTIADVDSVQEIASVFRYVLEKWSTGELLSLLPEHNACESYSAKVQTAALVRVFEGGIAQEPFIPGLVDIPPSLRPYIGENGWLK